MFRSNVIIGGNAAFLVKMKLLLAQHLHPFPSPQCVVGTDNCSALLKRVSKSYGIG